MKRKQIEPNWGRLQVLISESQWPVLYRAESDTYDDYGDTIIHFNSYPIIKYTPCGAWITEYGHERFVNLRGDKQFAYAKKEDALHSLKRRKMRQLSIIEHQVLNAKETIKLIDAGKLRKYEENECHPNDGMFIFN